MKKIIFNIFIVLIFVLASLLWLNINTYIDLLAVLILLVMCITYDLYKEKIGEYFKEEINNKDIQ